MRAGFLPLVVFLLAGCAEPGPVVAAGLTHSCDLRDGVVRCWGGDGFGQLGLDGARADRLDAGGDTTCVVSDEVVWCVGRNHHGQLGDGTVAPQSTPVEVARGAVDVSVGFAHACALDAEGRVHCWGWNGSGQSGSGEGDVMQPERVDLPPMQRVVAGYDTSCAMSAEQTLRCWGAIVLDEPDVRDVAVGADHVCALRADALVCWGAAPGGGQPAIDVPLSMPFEGGQLAAGAIDHLCVTDSEGAAHCLGKNTFGQLGRGDLRQPDAISAVFELGVPVTSLAVGGEHTCAVVAEQTWCWGWNAEGQLGNDAGLDSVVPVLVP